MASFNSFPIPTVLEQLKNADVDDAIHDIAERKHVFEGPMRLSPGRAYLIQVLATREATASTATYPIYLGNSALSYINFNANNTYSFTSIIIYVGSDKYYSHSCRASMTTMGGCYTSVDMTAIANYTDLTVSIRDDIEIVDFLITEL